MKKIYFFAILLMIGSITFAQKSSQFLAHWHSGNPAGEVGIRKTAQGPSGEFLIVGDYDVSVQIGANTAANANHSHYLMKLDASGNHQWTVTFGNPNYMFIQDLEVADDGSVFISGNFEDSISIQNYSRQDAGFQPFLWKINSSGNFEFALDFRSNPNKIARPRFSVANGGLTVTMAADDSLNFGFGFPSLLPNRSPNQVAFLGQYDYQGNLLSFENFDSPDDFFITETDRLDANRLLLQVLVDDSDSLYFGSTYFAGNAKKGTWFFELDSSFQVIQSHFIEFTNSAGFRYHGKTDSGDLMFAGGFSGIITDGNFSIQNQNAPGNNLFFGDGLYMVLNQNLAPILLESTGVKDNNDNISGIAELGGHYFISGSSSDGILLYRGDTLMNNTTSEAYVLQVDKNGDPQNFYRTESNSLLTGQTRFLSLYKKDPKTLAVTGTSNNNVVINGSDTLNRMSLRDGFIWTLTDPNIGLSEFSNHQNSTAGFYPNPANEKINLHHSLVSAKDWHLRVYGMDGSVIRETSHSDSSFEISGLKLGFYIFELRSGNKSLIARQKVLVQ